MPPAPPCRIRNSTSSGRLDATPHSAEAPVNSAMAVSRTRFPPYLSPSQPDAGMQMARLTRNAMEMPSTAVALTPKSRPMVGSATLTIVASRMDMNIAATKTTPTATFWLIRGVTGVLSPRLRPGCGSVNCCNVLPAYKTGPRRKFRRAHPCTMWYTSKPKEGDYGQAGAFHGGGQVSGQPGGGLRAARRRGDVAPLDPVRRVRTRARGRGGRREHRRHPRLHLPPDQEPGGDDRAQPGPADQLPLPVGDADQGSRGHRAPGAGRGRDAHHLGRAVRGDQAGHRLVSRPGA